MITYKKLKNGKSGNAPHTLYTEYVKYGGIALHTDVSETFNTKSHSR